MQRLLNPYPPFLDLVGALLDSGYIYVGTAGSDPEISPITVYLDSAGTIPAAQPLRTRGGYLINGSSPAGMFVSADDYSIRVRDADHNEVFFAPSAAQVVGGVSYQPLDADLTTISGQANTAFGLALLTLANSAALKAATGVIDGLPLGGGTVTGNIIRSGGGPHTYHTDPTYTSGRIYVTANGAADPTSLPGDIWIELE